jgi:preprotein translocase subunit SecG
VVEGIEAIIIIIIIVATFIIITTTVYATNLLYGTSFDGTGMSPNGTNNTTNRRRTPSTGTTIGYCTESSGHGIVSIMYGSNTTAAATVAGEIQQQQQPTYFVVFFFIIIIIIDNNHITSLSLSS